VGIDTRRSAAAAVSGGVLVLAAAFAIYHSTAGEVSVWFLGPPIALVLGLAAIIAARRARPRADVSLVVGIFLTVVAAWLVVGEALFFLTCWNLVHTGNC
jgi:hypothetical protein